MSRLMKLATLASLFALASSGQAQFGRPSPNGGRPGSGMGVIPFTPSASSVSKPPFTPSASSIVKPPFVPSASSTSKPPFVPSASSTVKPPSLPLLGGKPPTMGPSNSSLAGPRPPSGPPKPGQGSMTSPQFIGTKPGPNGTTLGIYRRWVYDPSSGTWKSIDETKLLGGQSAIAQGMNGPAGVGPVVNGGGGSGNGIPPGVGGVVNGGVAQGGRIEHNSVASSGTHRQNDEVKGSRELHEQTRKYLTVWNDTSETLTVHVQYRTVNDQGKWSWNPVDPASSEKAVRATVAPGKKASLRVGDWRLNASCVRIWAVSESGKKWVKYKNQNLWLVEEDSSGARRYFADSMKSFQFRFSSTKSTSNFQGD